ncbi:MAG: sigma-70 family RNA polymerase sigma factor [Proteobacteria bacterium]|nr:sigma-70 family RNA polymerase sigma factor [Pseudomonadota bacterium]
MNERASSQESTDGVLLRAVVEDQDRTCFRTLFDRYYPRVFVFIRRRLEDEELAREVTSDVFLEIWANAANFRGESKISTWIFGIARFKCMEAIRLTRRFKRSRVISTKDEVISQVPNSYDSGTDMAARQELRRVVVLMERLPEEQRLALEMTVLGGLPIEEVARRLEISRGTVKTRVSRARRALRRMLGDVTSDVEGTSG